MGAQYVVFYSLGGSQSPGNPPKFTPPTFDLAHHATQWVMIGIAVIVGTLILVCRFWSAIARRLEWLRSLLARSEPSMNSERTMFERFRIVLSPPRHQPPAPRRETEPPSGPAAPELEPLPLYRPSAPLPTYQEVTMHRRFSVICVRFRARIYIIFRPGETSLTAHSSTLQSDTSGPAGNEGYVVLGMLPNEPPPAYPHLSEANLPPGQLPVYDSHSQSTHRHGEESRRSRTPNSDTS